MKPNKEQRNYLIFAILIISVWLSAHCSAQETLSFSKQYFQIDDRTILLDREDIYHIPTSVKTPEEAFAKINGSKETEITLLIAPSVYWLDDPDEPEIRTDKSGTPYAVRINCKNLTMIGLTDKPEDVVFAVNRGQTQGAVGNFTMFNFKGESLSIENITFGNYCNVDLYYPRNPELNREKRKSAIVQAQIGICEGTDKLLAENCRFISRLNLCPFVGARRSLYEKCYFECTDDALSGSAVYLDCDFTFFSSKPFYSTAETGAVFLNCDIRCLGSGVQYFTKVPGLVTAIDTRFYCDNPIELRWTRDVSDYVCRQENITLNGKHCTIDADRPGLGPSLTDTSFKKAYKIENKGQSVYNIPNLLNGEDGWDPLNMNLTIAAIENETGTKLTGIPVALRTSVKAPEKIFNGDKISITTIPLLWGGYSTGPILEQAFKVENTIPEEKKEIIKIATDEGLTTQVTLHIEPNLRESPVFKKEPEIEFDSNSCKFSVDYILEGNGDDNSIITWSRVKEENGNLQVIQLFQGEAPKGRYFKATGADLGSSIIATVTPKYADSKAGQTTSTSFFEIKDPAQVEAIPESRLYTDFSNVSIERRIPGIIGAWSFDIYKPLDTSGVEWDVNEGPGWYYGPGIDAATGIGLQQNAKGARISYIPCRETCGNMVATLNVEPSKSGGQGFGSATSQYMDICIKFDPTDLTGYALRIERTPDHDRAVAFSLMEYKDGKTKQISEPIISNVYRTPCHITISYIDGMLKAEASTEASPSQKCCDEVKETVFLSSSLPDNGNSGFCIQHTGSWGPSATLIENVELEWQ